MNNSDIAELRRQVIKKRFKNMNDRQFEAVTTTQGPLLILAGAGSGKTTVLINRIACLLRFGNAFYSDYIPPFVNDVDCANMKNYIENDEHLPEQTLSALSVDAPRPWQILAITFTNKAAQELKNRLSAMLGDDGNEVWASTFHSMCVRILRRECEAIGFSQHFTIYDSDDSKRLMKECLRSLDIDEKRLSHKAVLSEISSAKNALQSLEELKKSVHGDIRREEIYRAYALYQKKLHEADAMDFDDLISNTVRLFAENPDVLERYRQRFRYIMVDEYQDTNHAQYILVSQLAGAQGNICVVGDDDQSIYRFRGATIENILSFEEQFPGTKTIRLEQNYRSTQTILDAANAVISNNKERKGKQLWTSNGDGEQITVNALPDDVAEGRFVADTIIDDSVSGYVYSDHAVLYRMNAQSNNIERALVRAGIPYRIIGGHRFYDRKEVKDALSYLAVISNPADDLRLRRIINEPKRGIGETTVNNCAEIASRLGESVFEVMKTADEFAAVSRASSKLKVFCELIESFRRRREVNTASELFRTVMTESGYVDSLANEPETAEERAQNLDELFTNIQRYEEENGEQASLEGFLEEVALMSDIDNYNADQDTVTLMTLHSAKGLEFPCVFIVGMENGIFPGMQSMLEESDMEEERRLAYVGITRAKKKLILTRASSRMMYGKTTSNPPSDFLREIPISLVNDISPKAFASRGGFGYEDSFFYSGSVEKRPHGSEGTTYQHRQKSAGGSSYDSGFSVGRPAAVKETAPLADYSIGERVLHKKFGSGTVLGTSRMGNDMLLEVAFDEVGTKKLMARAARLEKI